jgi:hypothetical protein
MEIRDDGDSALQRETAGDGPSLVGIIMRQETITG